MAILLKIMNASSSPPTLIIIMRSVFSFFTFSLIAVRVPANAAKNSRRYTMCSQP